MPLEPRPTHSRHWVSDVKARRVWVKWRFWVLKPKENRINWRSFMVTPSLTLSLSLSHYPTKSMPDLDGSSQILASLTKPKTNQYNPIPDNTQIGRSDKSSRSISGYFFPYPKFSGQVKLGINSTHGQSYPRCMQSPIPRTSSYYIFLISFGRTKNFSFKILILLRRLSW